MPSKASVPTVAKARRNKGVAPEIRVLLDRRREAGLLLPADHLILLQNHAAGRSALPEKLRLPLVHDAGRQRFEPAGPLRVDCAAELPCRAAEIEVRLLRVRDARVVAAGSLALSYFNVMPEAAKLPVTVEGLDLTSWPSAEAQDHILLQELGKRIAAAIS